MISTAGIQDAKQFEWNVLEINVIIFYFDVGRRHGANDVSMEIIFFFLC